MMKKLQCKCCGRTFVGWHNAMFCESCKVQRAKEASARTWHKVKIAKEAQARLDYGRCVGIFDIDNVDIDLARERGMSVGTFQLWKMGHQAEYLQLLSAHGYTVENGTVYKK